MTNEKAARYDQLIQAVFDNNYSAGSTSIEFERTEIRSRLRGVDDRDSEEHRGRDLYVSLSPPTSQVDSRPCGRWKRVAIMPNGRAKYRFQETVATRILPTQGLVVTKIPDATPEIVLEHPGRRTSSSCSNPLQQTDRSLSRGERILPPESPTNHGC